MSDVFVRDDQISDIKFYIKSKRDSVRLITQEKYNSLIASERLEYEECHVFLKPLTWGKSCQLQSMANTLNPMTNQRMFDPDKYVQLKLRAVISGWSFVSKNIKGEETPVKVTEENIDALHPIVADFVLKCYNERFELSEETRKNL